MNSRTVSLQIVFGKIQKSPSAPGSPMVSRASTPAPSDRDDEDSARGDEDDEDDDDDAGDVESEEERDELNKRESTPVRRESTASRVVSYEPSPPESTHVQEAAAVVA